MSRIIHIIVGLSGGYLVVWGSNYLPRLFYGPARQPWLGPLLMACGVLLSWYACVKVRKLALPLGIAFIGFAGLWLWNMQFALDPSRNPPGYQPDLSNWIVPAVCLIVIGTFFCVFFRYLKPSAASPEPAVAPGPSPTAEKDPFERAQGTTVWYRLAMLGCSVVIAAAASWLVGSDHAEERTKIFLGVLAFGAVATGLVRETTLAGLLSKSK